VRNNRHILTKGQIDFLNYCLEVKVTTGIEGHQITAAIKGGYLEGGAMQITFNKLRNKYLDVYEVVNSIL